MEQNFNELIQSETPVLVDVFADWCGPCQAMMPELDAYAKSIGDKARVIKVNIDRNPQLAQAFNIRGVPTLLLFKSGDLVWRASGWHSQSQLAAAVAPHINT